MIDPSTIDDWKQRLARMRSDEAFVQANHERDAKREVVREQIQNLFEQFVGGAVDLETLRATFDVKTRTEWDVFGLKGLSGAMFLNKIAKHLAAVSDQATGLLQAAVRPPGSDADARRAMRALHDGLVGFIETGVTSRTAVQPSRAPFLVSAVWHMEAPETWPVFYESMRHVLSASKLFDPRPGGPVEAYFRFAEVVRELKAALGIGIWELEHLCAREDAEAIPSPELQGTNGSPKGPRVWLVAPGRNAENWEQLRQEGLIGIGWRELGDFRAYKDLEAIKEALRKERGAGSPEPHAHALTCWEFAQAMKPGDVVFAKKGRHHIVGRGVVDSDYIHDAERAPFTNLRRVRWLWSGEVKPRERPLVMKTLTDVTVYPALVAQLEEAVEKAAGGPGGGSGDGEAPGGIVGPEPGAYGIDQAAAELFRPREEIEHLRELVLHRKNVVLQGPPGVGKTFVARRLADLIVGRRDPEHVCFVQFHQSYAYEDFIQGYRPAKGGGFELKDGKFLEFCDRALQDPEEPYVLIVDEINRGNLSKIFGELLMLIEADKRDPSWGVTLAYGDAAGERFHVPPNLFVIGTMNTADRSLAMVDYALRRRFAFVDVEPALAEPSFLAHLAKLGATASLVERIRDRVARVNGLIAKDEGLGRGYLVGHSYFCQSPAGGVCDDAWFERIVDFELEPLLREYWFDRPERAEEAVAHLLGDA